MLCQTISHKSISFTYLRDIVDLLPWKTMLQ